MPAMTRGRRATRTSGARQGTAGNGVTRAVYDALGVSRRARGIVAGPPGVAQLTRTKPLEGLLRSLYEHRAAHPTHAQRDSGVLLRRENLPLYVSPMVARESRGTGRSGNGARAAPVRQQRQVQGSRQGAQRTLRLCGRSTMIGPVPGEPLAIDSAGSTALRRRRLWADAPSKRGASADRASRRATRVTAKLPGRSGGNDRAQTVGPHCPRTAIGQRASARISTQLVRRKGMSAGQPRRS